MSCEKKEGRILRRLSKIKPTKGFARSVVNFRVSLTVLRDAQMAGESLFTVCAYIHTYTRICTHTQSMSSINSISLELPAGIKEI